MLFIGLPIIGTVVGLSVYFTQRPDCATTIAPTTSATTTSATTTTNTTPAVKDHVLLLSTKSSKNIPMVIGLNGEPVLPFYSVISYIDIFLLS